MAETHEILGVAPDASADEISEAYRTLVQIYHPDKYMDSPTRVQAEATRRMQEINRAYEAMMDAVGKPVVYRTKAWTNRRKGLVTEGLLDAGVPHSWDGDFLTVARPHNRVADSLVLHRASANQRDRSATPHRDSNSCPVCGKTIATGSYERHMSRVHPRLRMCVAASCYMRDKLTDRQHCPGCGGLTQLQ